MARLTPRSCSMVKGDATLGAAVLTDADAEAEGKPATAPLAGVHGAPFELHGGGFGSDEHAAMISPTRAIGPPRESVPRMADGVCRRRAGSKPSPVVVSVHVDRGLERERALARLRAQGGQC